MKNPGVVACGYPPDPPPLRFPHKKRKAHLPVAESTGVRSEPPPVGRKGGLHDQPSEILLGLDHLVRDAQFFCGQSRGVDGAAGVFVRFFGSPKPEGDSLDLVAGFFEEVAGHGGVHPARHPQKHFLRHHAKLTRERKIR
jgi:hypothetical protein